MSDIGFDIFQRRIEEADDIIYYATVDFISPPKVKEGTSVSIGGVVVLKNNAPRDCELFLDVKIETLKVNWGIESPRMKQMYPDSVNSSFSRFKVDFTWPKGVESVTLLLKTTQGTSIPLIELFLNDNTEKSYFKIWEANLPEEIHFWELIISGKHPNKEWVEDFRRRAKGA